VFEPAQSSLKSIFLAVSDEKKSLRRVFSYLSDVAFGKNNVGVDINGKICNKIIIDNGFSSFL